MYTELNERLAELKGKARQKANWQRRLDWLEAELPKRIRERDRLQRKFDKERKDVERLSGLSLGALFYTLLGQKGAKLGREEAEMLQAKLNYEEARDTVRDMEAEKTDLARKIRELRFVEDDIRRLMEQKSALIMRTHPDLAARLQELTEREAEAGADLKELGEAEAAGRKVLKALSRAEDRLNSASGWGTFDMLGGGLIATAMKHSRIDEARSAIHDAQNALHRFQNELLDVKRDVHLQIEIGTFLTFADFFFDGLIFDWIVQGRIHDTLKQITEKRQAVQRIVSDLEAARRQTEERRQKLRREREQLIEQA